MNSDTKKISKKISIILKAIEKEHKHDKNKLFEFLKINQELEEILKLSINISSLFLHKIVNQASVANLSYKTINESELTGLSLGRLISRYSRFSNDKKLISQLELYVNKRNEIIHNFFGAQYEDKGEIYRFGDTKLLNQGIKESRLLLSSLEKKFIQLVNSFNEKFDNS